MTLEEAVAAAQAFVARLDRPVILEPEEVRPMSAARFNALLGRPVYPCDFWVMDFRKVLPPDVVCETPGCVTVEVIPATGEVREVYVGMHSG